MKNLGSHFPIVLLAGLAACSTASYQKQVGEMSSGLADVKSSFATLAAREQQAYVEDRTLLGLRHDSLIQIPPECGVTPSAAETGDLSGVNCRPQVRTGATTEAGSFASAVPNALALASSLADYGQGLVSLAGAEDVAQLKAAIGQSAAAIANLAATTGAAEAAAVGPVTSVLSWLAGKYLDERRLEELRNAATKAAPLIDQASALLVKQAKLLQTHIVAQKATVVSIEATALQRYRKDSPNDRLGHLEAGEKLVADALAVQALADANVALPFQKMKSAHAALVASLENPEISLSDAFAEINEFVKQIEKLRSILTPAAAGGN